MADACSTTNGRVRLVARPARVSVVVPTYQRRRLVGEALASVLVQSEADFEVIVVDDGSTDGTLESLAPLAARDPRVRLLRKGNGGTASARNAGLDAACAEWTAFLDSDDLWVPDCLERQLAFAAAHPESDMVLCDVRYEGAWGRQEASIFTAPGWLAPDSLGAMLDGAWALPSGMLVRTALGRRLRFSTEFQHSEDTEFLFRFHAEGHRTCIHPAVLALWRRHDGGEGAPQKIEASLAMEREQTRMLARYAHLAGPRSRLHGRIARAQALDLVEAGRWREARPHLWRWWRRRPDSMRALRYLLRSLLARPRSEIPQITDHTSSDPAATRRRAGGGSEAP